MSRQPSIDLGRKVGSTPASSRLKTLLYYFLRDRLRKGKFTERSIRPRPPDFQTSFNSQTKTISTIRNTKNENGEETNL